MKIDPAVQERQAFLFLDQFPWEAGCVIIGGYAILGYGTLRYSRDLDILILLRLSEKIKGWFTEKEFSVEKTATPNPQNYDGRYVRYLKSELTIDLFIGAVRDREAKVDIPDSWISKRPHHAENHLIKWVNENRASSGQIRGIVGVKNAGRQIEGYFRFVLRIQYEIFKRRSYNDIQRTFMRQLKRETIKDEGKTESK